MVVVNVCGIGGLFLHLKIRKTWTGGEMPAVVQVVVILVNNKCDELS